MFIDIHVHTRRRPGFPRANGQTYQSPAGLIERYDRIGVEQAVILPGVSPEHQHVPQSMEDVLEICEAYPGRFIPFCNIDPRMIGNSPDTDFSRYLDYYKARGCKGVGEITANLPFNDPMVENMFSHCEATQMPVIFHMAPTVSGNYGLYDEPGLPLLEGALKKFPNLVFLGHSQAFWAEIAPLPDPDARRGYPSGPVTAPGRVVELMRRFPNLHGDLSAGSGFNAVSRDEAFGVAFLDEFQDRLYFGTDICAPENKTPLVDYLIRLRDASKISPVVFEKIARGNAIKLLQL